MDAKTPVTLLQELLLKRKETPDYVLVHNGAGTHDPLFVYEVSGLGKTAVGRGKSKREAKHAAAQELLYIIGDIEKKIDGVVQSPYADVVKENAIGALQDFCSMNMISQPTYEQTRDEGLPHAKLFGVKCTVSSLVTQAEARTKKQAKQIAAQLMLAKLKDCLKTENFSIVTEKEQKSNLMTENELKALKKIEEYYQNDEKRIPKMQQPLGTPLDRYDTLFKQDLYLSSEALTQIKDKDDNYFNKLDSPATVFNEIMRQLDLLWDTSEIGLRPGKAGKIMCVQIKQLNNATFFGTGCDEESALKSAYASGLKWLSIMTR